MANYRSRGASVVFKFYAKSNINDMNKKMPDWIIALLKGNFIRHVINKLTKDELREIGVDDTKRSHIRNRNKRDIPSISTLAELKRKQPDFDMNLIFEEEE